MGVLCERDIINVAEESAMITPFVPHKEGDGRLSFGVSSYGYDARVHNQYKMFTNTYNALIDPKSFPEDSFISIEDEVCTIPPHGFALARTVEYFRIPRDVIALCVGKSTYARCGIVINVTPLEPGWEGYVTIEISNTAPLPVKIYSWEGICQFIFFRGEACKLSYSDIKGKYMKQESIVLPKV